jgi:hypothetical protein
LLWTFVDACVRGRLPFDECSPVFYLGAITALILMALVALVVLILRRTRSGAGT